MERSIFKKNIPDEPIEKPEPKKRIRRCYDDIPIQNRKHKKIARENEKLKNKIAGLEKSNSRLYSYKYRVMNLCQVRRTWFRNGYAKGYNKAMGRMQKDWDLVRTARKRFNEFEIRLFLVSALMWRYEKNDKIALFVIISLYDYFPKTHLKYWDIGYKGSNSMSKYVITGQLNRYRVCGRVYYTLTEKTKTIVNDEVKKFNAAWKSVANDRKSFSIPGWKGINKQKKLQQNATTRF